MKTQVIDFQKEMQKARERAEIKQQKLHEIMQKRMFRELDEIHSDLIHSFSSHPMTEKMTSLEIYSDEHYYSHFAPKPTLTRLESFQDFTPDDLA